MEMKRSKRALSLFLCMVLTVAMALVTTGCNGSSGKEGQTEGQSEAVQMQNESTEGTENTASADVTVLGEGSREFMFTVTDQEGNETQFEIHTDKETVGEALLDLGLISGEDGDYGLYVKTVNGITADYDTDGVYWAFYINGEYASTGVDSTAITDGDSYSFKVEK